jgi:hypothetical protein
LKVCTRKYSFEVINVNEGFNLFAVHLRLASSNTRWYSLFKHFMENSEQENSSWSSHLLVHEQASIGEFVGIGGEDAHAALAALATTSSDALPPGWKASKDQNGNQYYYNKELNITQWSRPAFSGGSGGMGGGGGMGDGGGRVGGGPVGLDMAAIPMHMPPMPQMIQHVHVPVERVMVVNSHVFDSNIPMQMSPVIQHVQVPVERVRIVEVPKYVDRRVVKVVDLLLSLSRFVSFLSLLFCCSLARAR